MINRFNVINNKYKELKFISRLLLRSFLISICVLLSSILLFASIYFGDIIINSYKGSYVSPLFGFYIIVSPSMVPTIQINDGIIIKRLDHDNYDIGDIITFSSNDSNYEGLTVTHRVVKKKNVKMNNSMYTTKGDNNPVIDPSLVDTDSIYGKVLVKIPKIGYVRTFFSKPINYFFSLLIPIIIMIVYEFYRIRQMIKEKEI